MVYIVGIDHLVQYNGPIPEHLLDEFKEFISVKIIEYNISVIAEEFNEEFLYDVLGATEATAYVLAEKYGIEHIYCDPDQNEREEMGIPYYAEIRDEVRKRFNVNENIIFDNVLRKKLDSETASEVKKYWPLREKFWFDRIREKLSENIIFLCGHEHVYRFMEYLSMKGADVYLIDQFWKSEIFIDYGKLGLR